MGASNRWSNCQRTLQSTGWDSNPRFRITGAESSPLDDQCFSQSVGPEGLEPSPTWLRARHAAANTLIPFRFLYFCAHNPRGGSRTLDLILIRNLLSPLSYARSVGPKGVEPLPFRLKGGSATVTPQPQMSVEAYAFEPRASCHHRSFSSFKFLFSGSPENRTQRHLDISRVWATSPRLPFSFPCSQSGWPDSNRHDRVPKTRGLAVTQHPDSIACFFQ